MKYESKPVTGIRPEVVESIPLPHTTAVPWRFSDWLRFLPLDLKLSPCSECCMLSSGWFTCVWSLYADVSEHSVPSSRLWRWIRQSVPKRWYITFRRRWITKKEAYNFFWSQFVSSVPAAYSTRLTLLFSTILIIFWVGYFINYEAHLRKAIPVQVWTGPEGTRRLRLPDFKTIGNWRW
jgi:hypothetical protein